MQKEFISHCYCQIEKNINGLDHFDDLILKKLLIYCDTNRPNRNCMYTVSQKGTPTLWIVTLRRIDGFGRFLAKYS